MADYEVYVADAGTPKTGIVPDFETLIKRGDGAAVTPPTVSELSGGWYKFSHTVPAGEVHVGVIDADQGAALADSDRFIPIRLSPEDTHVDAAVSTRAVKERSHVI